MISIPFVLAFTLLQYTICNGVLLFTIVKVSRKLVRQKLVPEDRLWSMGVGVLLAFVWIGGFCALALIYWMYRMIVFV